MRRLCALGLALTLTPWAHGGELDATLQGTLRGVGVRSAETWLLGGFGRLGESGEDETGLRGQAHLSLDWKPHSSLLFHVHARAQGEPHAYGGERVAVPEAFLQWRSSAEAGASLWMRAGTFFPQTSRENVAPLWSSPYTLTLSALNSWLAEEVRLTGIETTGRLALGPSDELQLSAAAFVMNDTAGALLAWRGFSLGDRLTGIAESLPLPPLRSLQPGGGFAEQAVGTRPLDELDGRVGLHGRVRWTQGERALLQAAYTDNRGDERLHAGQYAWHARYGQAGLELGLPGSLRLVGEAMLGTTKMGPRDGAHVDLRFATAYGLLTWGDERRRVSARYDRFRNLDRDGTEEPGNESGYAVTVAFLFSPLKPLRFGLEYLEVHGPRPAALDSGFAPRPKGRRVLVELRGRF